MTESTEQGKPVDRAAYLALQLREALHAKAVLRNRVLELQRENAQLNNQLDLIQAGELDREFDLRPGVALRKLEDGSYVRIDPPAPKTAVEKPTKPKS